LVQNVSLNTQSCAELGHPLTTNVNLMLKSQMRITFCMLDIHDNKYV
jgi:hypothetical protein